MNAVLSDYFLNIDSDGDRQAAEDDARERWDEDHPLDEVIDSAVAYDILNDLLCDPAQARLRLERELDAQYAKHIRQAQEDF